MAPARYTAPASSAPATVDVRTQEAIEASTAHPLPPLSPPSTPSTLIRPRRASLIRPEPRNRDLNSAPQSHQRLHPSQPAATDHGPYSPPPPSRSRWPHRPPPPPLLPDVAAYQAAVERDARPHRPVVAPQRPELARPQRAAGPPRNKCRARRIPAREVRPGRLSCALVKYRRASLAALVKHRRASVAALHSTG